MLTKVILSNNETPTIEFDWNKNLEFVQAAQRDIPVPAIEDLADLPTNITEYLKIYKIENRKSKKQGLSISIRKLKTPSIFEQPNILMGQNRLGLDQIDEEDGGIIQI